MAKRKRNKQKYTVVRTDGRGASKMDKKTKKALGAVALALASLLAKKGLDAIPAPPSVGFIFVGLAAALGWFALIHSGLFEFLTRKYIKYPGYATIIVVTLILALCVRRGKPDVPKDASPTAVTPPPITTSVQNSPGSSVVNSQGQSGGITAREVKIEVNNYFGNQSSDERQALNQKLLAKYPRGYAVFGVVDGQPTRTIEGLSFERDFEIVWTGSEIAKFEADYINFYPPQIIYKPTGNAALGAFNLRLLRKVGFTAPYPLLPKWTSVFLEVLDDKGSFAVVVLGFRE